MDKDLTPDQEKVLLVMTYGYPVERCDGSDDGYWAAVMEQRWPRTQIDSHTMTALRQKGYLTPSTDGTRWIITRRARDLFATNEEHT
jgi:hypothetical protein